MAVIERHDATEAELKWFGLVGAAFLGLIGGLAWWRGQFTSAIVLWSLALALLGLYYTLRSLRRPLFDLWMGLAYPIGWVISHLMLGIVFYLVMTPIGLIMRLLGHDPMNRGFDRSARSYWSARDQRTSAARYYQQF